MNRAKKLLLAGLPLLCVAFLLQGCSHMPLMDPKGPIGVSERYVILVSVGLMLIVVIPVAIMTILFR